ncbi:hypothetical protein KIW84_072460 [Lathyrus oleraceus]|uniref:Uncharacterized protein n=1 Tax=Pisum sativum TaxID=3888 RepID=A0A9D4ZUD9_PEA|nr:hypothetical protein KIW84_072460 [Pisum sativum]
MSTIAQVALTLMLYNIGPRSHTSIILVESFYLLYYIVYGREIDVVRIIANEIKEIEESGVVAERYISRYCNSKSVHNREENEATLDSGLGFEEWMRTTTNHIWHQNTSNHRAISPTFPKGTTAAGVEHQEQNEDEGSSEEEKGEGGSDEEQDEEGSGEEEEEQDDMEDE